MNNIIIVLILYYLYNFTKDDGATTSKGHISLKHVASPKDYTVLPTPLIKLINNIFLI